jgi:hypothetical protein
MTNVGVLSRASRNLFLVFAVVAGIVAIDGLNTASAQGRGRGRPANALTGSYRLNPNLSDNAAALADQATRGLPGRDQQRLRNIILRRLDAPEELAIERRGRAITLASSNAEPVTFEADGRVQTELTRNGRSIRTTTTLVGDRLDVTTSGDRSVDYQVSFAPINGGQSLRVTRRISDEGLRQTVVARSVYDRISTDPRLDMYSGYRDRGPRAGEVRNDRPDVRNDRPDVDRTDFGVAPGTEIIATLDGNLSTRQARPEDAFTLTVRSPAQFEGARIDGRIANVDRAGQVAGRADMAFDFGRISLRNGRTFDFNGYLEGIRTTKGETLRVENGSVQDESSQTARTSTNTGIGAGIGALIGAIAGGGKGAAIGAAVGAGAGAGSAIVQSRDDLELLSGSEFRIRAADPRR